MATDIETERSHSFVRLPRAYTRLDDDTFAKQLLALFGTSTEASSLAEPLLPDQELTVAQYIRQHLSYTVYLLSLVYEESPNLGYIVIPVARHLMTDQYLRCNYKRLEQVSNFPKSLISRLEQLDRETWFSQPLLGSHLAFDSHQSDGSDVTSPVTTVSGSLYTTGDRTDLAKVSTNEAPLSGQTHARVQISPSEHLLSTGRHFRRLEVLRLLARSTLTVDKSSSSGLIKQHTSLPAYTYTHKEKSYMLLSPEISADVNPEDPSHYVCSLSQFIVCRPDWWVALSKEEKRVSVFRWMTCLAATVHLFHSLKITHGDIYPKNIYLVKNGNQINIFLEGWYQSSADPRILEMSRKRPNLKSNKSFGYGVPETTSSDGRPTSRKGTTPDISTAEASRSYDIKCLGEVLSELVLVLLGLTKDILNRQRKERLDWQNKMRVREGNSNWSAPFYPKPNSTTNSETSASSVTSELIEVNVPTPDTSSGTGTVAQQASASKTKLDVVAKNSKTSAKEPASRPGSIFGGMFGSKSKESSKAPEPEANSKNKISSRMSYGIASKLASSVSNNATPVPTWWLEELKIMYPPFQGETDNATWNKHSDLIGNHLLLLISAMSHSEAVLRPTSEIVWKDLTRIVTVFFKGKPLCCSAQDMNLKEERETLKENILDNIYRRGIPDEEEEGWDGVGGEGSDIYSKNVGLRGEGTVGESLFD